MPINISKYKCNIIPVPKKVFYSRGKEGKISAKIRQRRSSRDLRLAGEVTSNEFLDFRLEPKLIQPVVSFRLKATREKRPTRAYVLPSLLSRKLLNSWLYSLAKKIGGKGRGKSFFPPRRTTYVSRPSLAQSPVQIFRFSFPQPLAKLVSVKTGIS